MSKKCLVEVKLVYSFQNAVTYSSKVDINAANPCEIVGDNLDLVYSAGTVNSLEYVALLYSFG